MIDPAFVVAAAVNRAQGVALSVASFEGGSSVDARMIPPAKVQSSCLYDARVLLQGDCFDEVLVKARRLDKEGGEKLLYVQSFDDPLVMACFQGAAMGL